MADRRRILLIANPHAGGGRAVAAAGTAARELRERGVSVQLVAPPSAGAIDASARIAAAEGLDALVAVGGDGTAHHVANACLAHGLSFGLVPAGTGNDNARTFGIPRGDAVAAAAGIAAALERGGRSVDVARASCADGTERAYLGVLSTGFDSAVNERANRMTRPQGTARYLAALAGELTAFRPIAYDIDADGTVIAGRGMLACVANGGTYGGGMRVCPDAAIDDGLLDLTFLGEVPVRTFLRVFPRVFRGTHVRHPAVRTVRATRVTVAADGAVAYADGERLGPLPVRVSAEPKALRLLAPS